MLDRGSTATFKIKKALGKPDVENSNYILVVFFSAFIKYEVVFGGPNKELRGQSVRRELVTLYFLHRMYTSTS